MAEFDKVVLKIGYVRYYATLEDAMKVMRVFNEVDLLLYDTRYAGGKSIEVAIPPREDHVSICNADPAAAFRRMSAGEACGSEE